MPNEWMLIIRLYNSYRSRKNSELGKVKWLKMGYYAHVIRKYNSFEKKQECTWPVIRVVVDSLSLWSVDG